MKVTENVEKGGAVLKMVSSSTGFLKDMMELSLVAAVPNATSSTVGNVSDGSLVSPEFEDSNTMPQPLSANGPSSVQSSVVGSGDKTTSRRLGKGLAWLRRRCRQYGAPPSSSEQANHCSWRRRDLDDQSSTTAVRPTTAPNAIPTSVNAVDRTIVTDSDRSLTSLVRSNNDGRQDTAVGGVYEKRAMWLKHCRKVADADLCRANAHDENGTAISGFSSDELSAEKLDVAISVVSDGQTDTVQSPSNVNAGFVAGEYGAIDLDDKQNEYSGGAQAEVVLDPAALSLLVASDQHKLSVAEDCVQFSTTAHSPVMQPRESDTDYRVEDNVHVVTPKRPGSIMFGPVGSSAANHTEQCEPSSSSSDVDFISNEIGRLVADYIRQQLVFFTRFSRQKSIQTTHCKS